MDNKHQYQVQNQQGIRVILKDELTDDEINDIKDINVIKKINEKGFIEPLEYKDLVLIERELKNKEEL